MRVLSPLDLRRSLGAILDAASAGERFIVERDRRPLAMLVSVEDGRRLEPEAEEVRARRLAALVRLEALGRRAGESRSRGPGRPALPPAPAGAVPPATPRPTPTPLAEPSATPASPAAPGAAARRPIRPLDRFEAERRRHALGDEVVPGG